MKKQLKKEVDIEIPSLPNFIRTSDQHFRSVISISEFSEEELQKIGEEWTCALIKKAKKKIKN